MPLLKIELKLILMQRRGHKIRVLWTLSLGTVLMLAFDYAEAPSFGVCAQLQGGSGRTAYGHFLSALCPPRWSSLVVATVASPQGPQVDPEGHDRQGEGAQGPEDL